MEKLGQVEAEQFGKLKNVESHKLSPVSIAYINTNKTV